MNPKSLKDRLEQPMLRFHFSTPRENTLNKFENNLCYKLLQLLGTSLYTRTHTKCLIPSAIILDNIDSSIVGALSGLTSLTIPLKVDTRH